MQELLAWANQVGYSLHSFELDGKIHRFDRHGKKNAWYVGFQLHTIKNGEPYYILIIGDWKTGDKQEFRSKVKYERQDKEIISQRIVEAQQRAEEERAVKQKEAVEYANKLWNQAKPVFASDYFERKKITELHGSKTQLDDDGRIVFVPMVDINNELQGLQRIFPDGTKRFITGQKTSGLFHVIGSLDEELFYICEGFATGASIRQATGKTTIVSFNATNLVNVATEIRKKYITKTIIICGDDDTKTEGNPGRTKALEAARVSLGKAIFPDGYNDFNDMYVDKGTIKLEVEEPEVVGYIPLGFLNGKHFFFDKKTNTIKQLSSFSPTEMFELMPIEYWETAYVGKKGIRWDQARSDIIQQSNAVGMFDNTRIRGTGVWLDGGKVVVNSGCGLERKKSRYIYVASQNKMLKINSEKLSTNDCAKLVDACALLKWKDPKSFILLSGWLAIARIAGALPVRPHVWVTGGSGTGKSTCIDLIVRPCLGDDSNWLYLQGGATEAGIRQTVQYNSIPIIFDEFESTNMQTKERTQNIIELLRQTWSFTSGHIIKGSATGKPERYSLNFAALVSSIRITLENDADRSRFSILELDNHNSDQEHFKRLMTAVNKLDTSFGEKLFSRMIEMIPIIVESYEVFRSVIAGIINQRYGQQYGMLCAGWWALTSDNAVTQNEAKSIVSDLNFGEQKIDSEDTDQVECLNHLLTTKVRIQAQHLYSSSSEEKTIAEILEANLQQQTDQLKTFGILVKDDTLIISDTHSTLKSAIFRGTRWENGWAKSLARLPGAEKATPARFGKLVTRATKIKLNS